MAKMGMNSTHHVMVFFTDEKGGAAIASALAHATKPGASHLAMAGRLVTANEWTHVCCHRWIYLVPEIL